MQGRLGAVRVKQDACDCCVFVGYAPVVPRDDAGKGACWLFWEDLSFIISLLPARCVPVLLIDVKAHVGFLPDFPEGNEGQEDEHVGCCNPEK